MRKEFLEPGGELCVSTVQSTLSLVVDNDVFGKSVTSIISRWSKDELLLVYDWAIREHFGAAGNRMQRRPKPYLVELVEEAASLAAGGTT